MGFKAGDSIPLLATYIDGSGNAIVFDGGTTPTAYLYRNGTLQNGGGSTANTASSGSAISGSTGGWSFSLVIPSGWTNGTDICNIALAYTLNGNTYYDFLGLPPFKLDNVNPNGYLQVDVENWHNTAPYALDAFGKLLVNLSTIQGNAVTASGPVAFSSGTVSNYAGGNVTVGGYASGQDPATLLLATPANKLATNGSGAVTVAGSVSVAGDVTVGGYASGQDPATLLLATPANKLATNGSGAVTVAGSVSVAGDVTVGGYASGQDPATLLLATPANKLATNGSGAVTVAGSVSVAGDVIVGGYASGQDPAALLAAAGYTPTRAGYLDDIPQIKAQTDNLPDIPAAQSDVVGVWTTAMTEAYAANGSAMSPAEALHMIYSVCAQFAVSGTSIVAKKLDGATTALTFTMDSATAPTERARTA